MFFGDFEGRRTRKAASEADRAAVERRRRGRVLRAFVRQGKKACRQCTTEARGPGGPGPGEGGSGGERKAPRAKQASVVVRRPQAEHVLRRPQAAQASAAGR